jgi:PRTRC genetic system protein C
MSPEEIKAAYSVQFPELATAAITGPEVVGDKLRWEFALSVGAKG